MNYIEQQKFLRRSRIWGAVSVLALGAAASGLFVYGQILTPSLLLAPVLIVLTLALSLCYTPNYLYLTVNTKKRTAWQVKIRWRLIGAALLLGLLLAPHGYGTLATLVAVAWLTAANILAKAIVPGKFFAAYFFATDFILIGTLLLMGQCHLLLAALLLAAAIHLSVLLSERHPLPWALVVAIAGGLLFLGAGREAGLSQLFFGCALLLVAAIETAWLVRRASEQNEKNIAAAMAELVEFTGYSAERIRHLWSVSNQELAKNWQAAALDESDREKMAAWYRENSELYLFAISAYNLEYKRICSNLRVLQLGRGACLDYGAGNGELLLELARRGHPVTYYDVEGTTMKFARQRAKRQGLSMEFYSEKKDLAQAAKQRGFDTIFSFDVLEHLPDLPGELNFLSSLLNPGGMMVFDVPAGSTKAHPMHLNHNLDVRVHLTAKGLEEDRSLVQRLPFLKQEKYAFRVRA